ncbi:MULTISPECIES: phosphoribosyltransferase [unclassified Actinomyces]|uniref:phosphoribosyltransferase n=1 Tax=unclassified Actinomyces TaxID=2609248 RepID=UPI002017195C|nr:MULTISPECIES: phosphoribosyltransferase [unclassified Actinomyces]MCL3777349.1 phosphoribosyltransferase [Actinomyces sp. AC-20-1]MCL3790483.1 phosphoribosyltransferase [Actinomyces sp. 187325]MCL3792751.1 phosphoribosyltransferase [Actinomyces sp. 186855]MCL3794945.1 phosphoribosyltransferase [Actinomyces sp. 217892]
MSDASSTPTTRTPFDDGATSDAAPEREELTWELFGQAERELSAQIVASGWMPDLIIAIARGGLIPAGAIGYAIGIKAMGAMNVEFYTGVGQTLPEPVVLPPLMDASELPGKKVLVVDDVADSGKTLKMVMEMLRHEGLDLGDETVAVDARSAVIYRKPRSVFAPDYCWRETDKWINFPWSVLPVITPQSLAEQGLAADQEAQDQADTTVSA